MAIKLFSHTDLDGVSCAIIAFWAFGEENVDVEYCDYDDIDYRVQEFLSVQGYKRYDNVFITDISINKDTANLIEYVTLEHPFFKDRFQLIDHHVSAKWLNEYEWAYVNEFEESIYPHKDRMKSCGTTLFYKWLEGCGYLIDQPDAKSYIETVRMYDTWDWTEFEDIHAKKFNDLFFLIGRKAFVNRMLYENSTIGFSEEENFLLDNEQYRINEYVKKKQGQMFVSKFEDYHVGVVYAEQYISQLGNELAKDNPFLDFIALIDVGEGKVSFRGIHDHIDLSEIARRYGGGGHPKSAGCPLNKAFQYQWIQFLN